MGNGAIRDMCPDALFVSLVEELLLSGNTVIISIGEFPDSLRDELDQWAVAAMPNSAWMFRSQAVSNPGGTKLTNLLSVSCIDLTVIRATANMDTINRITAKQSTTGIMISDQNGSRPFRKCLLVSRKPCLTAGLLCTEPSTPSNKSGHIIKQTFFSSERWFLFSTAMLAHCFKILMGLKQYWPTWTNNATDWLGGRINVWSYF